MAGPRPEIKQQSRYQLHLCELCENEIQFLHYACIKSHYKSKKANLSREGDAKLRNSRVSRAAEMVLV
jgi:hypothetical protein